jgi:cell wall assembly regulator SMI1
MGVALGFTGWWMYIDVPATPNAVVICVIVFNAAFGYRYVVATLFGEFVLMIF